MVSTKSLLSLLEKPASAPNAFDVDDVLSKLTAFEKSSLLSGINFWHTFPIPALNVPSIRVSDGPNGIRGDKFFSGAPAACLPCGTALGATWDKPLLQQAGTLLGEECIAKRVQCWLGPTVNIQRAPLGGRGFESFSEDPHLSGMLASAIISGVEGTGVTACIKHFVANDQEHERRAVDTIITPRALREVYLRPFQIAAREVRPGACMTSYNKINGTHVSEDKNFLQGIIREEWGWDPLIMSDWYGTYSTDRALNAGLDLEMPGKTRHRGPAIEFATSARLVKQSTVTKRARKVLEFVNQASKLKVAAVEGPRDLPEDRALNRKLCGDSIVLLKNDGGILPLSKKLKKVALIGSHVKEPAIGGGGSASLLPYYKVSLYEAVKANLPTAEILYATGAYAHKMLPVLDDRLLSNSKIIFFNEPSSIENRQSVGEELLTVTNFQLMDYTKNPKLNFDLFYASVEADFIPDASGLWDFGISACGTANLYIDDELIIDATTVQRLGETFFGRGSAEEFGTKTVVAGKTYKVRIDFGSYNTSKLKGEGVVSFGGGGARLGACLRSGVDEAIAEAVKIAKECEHVVLCTGLNSDWETEAADRKNMDLPPNIDNLIASVLAANPSTIIVNQSGTPVTMPWASSAQCIVQAWYGGNETGNGIADVLFGSVNPSGKLPLSWPKDVRDNPAYLNWGAVRGRVLYGEDYWVGWKGYERVGREPLFPFGHGLSYTTFETSNLKIDPISRKATLALTNTGPLPGAEVLQLYISAPNSPTERPLKELHGFSKVFLQPGEKRTVEIVIDPYAGSFWDEIEDCWRLEKGIYRIWVASSSQEGARGLGADWIVEKERLWKGL